MVNYSNYYTWETDHVGDQPISLLRQCENANRNDFFWFILHWGIKGIGKSNSVLAFNHDIIKKLKPDWPHKRIFEFVLKSVVFDIPMYDATIDELKNSILACTAENGFPRVPCLNWDDIGMYFGKRIKLTDEKEQFLREFHAIREELAVLQGTTPAPDDPQKALRDGYTHEVFWGDDPGFGMVEYYQRAFSKKAGEAKIYKKFMHHLNSRWIPLQFYQTYRLMKRDAKDRLRQLRMMNFTPGDIKRLLEGPLALGQDQQVLCLIYKACGRKAFATTKEVHTLYFNIFGLKEKYVGYLNSIYRNLHGHGVIVYRVRGRHGEVTLTQKGIRTIEKLMDTPDSAWQVVQKPRIIQTTQTAGT